MNRSNDLSPHDGIPGVSVSYTNYRNRDRELLHIDSLRNYHYYHDIINESLLHNFNINQFRKIDWLLTCSCVMKILNVYQSLQYVASTCGKPLSGTDETNGVYPLTKSNCHNFQLVYKLMSTALYLKMDEKSIWSEYDTGWNITNCDVNELDGFETLNNLLAEILFSFNKETGKTHRTPTLSNYS